jgi:hypothetical protein
MITLEPLRVKGAKPLAPGLAQSGFYYYLGNKKYDTIQSLIQVKAAAFSKRDNATGRETVKGERR